MTPEEALKIIDETVIGNLQLKIAVSKSLEKQIPKKPVHLFHSKKRLYSCCNNHAVAKFDPYCKWCGQKLDWSDTQ